MQKFFNSKFESITQLIYDFFLFLIDKSFTLILVTRLFSLHYLLIPLIQVIRYFVISVHNHDGYAPQEIFTLLFKVFVIHCFSEPQIIGHFPVITLPVFVQHKKKLSFFTHNNLNLNIECSKMEFSTPYLTLWKKEKQANWNVIILHFKRQFSLQQRF